MFTGLEIILRKSCLEQEQFEFLKVLKETNVWKEKSKQLVDL